MFGVYSPILVLRDQFNKSVKECLKIWDEKNFELNVRLLIKFINKQPADKKEKDVLRRLNHALDIPQLFVYTEKNPIKSILQARYYHLIPKRLYTKALNIAVCMKDQKSIDYLISRGARPDVYTSVTIVRHGDLELLKRFHKLNCPWDGWTLYWACHEGHLDCLKFAHENGCKWDRRFCAEIAASRNHMDCLKYCLDNGSPVSGETVRWAAENGHAECLKYAIRHGCSISRVLNNPYLMENITDPVCIKIMRDSQKERDDRRKSPIVTFK